jgi:hydrogenase/urease accessory protein HupE
MPYSMVNISVIDKSIQIKLEMPMKDFEKAIDIYYKNPKVINPSSFNDRIHDYLLEHFNIISNRGTRQNLKISSFEIKTLNAGLNNEYKELHVEFKIDPSEDFEIQNFILINEAIIRQVGSHYTIVRIDKDFMNGITPEDSLDIGVIRRGSNNYIQPFFVSMEKGSSWKAFKKMVALGMHHIQTGLDHLLFIVLLILISPLVIVQRKWAGFGGWKYFMLRIFKMITAFTIGHSLTLLLFTATDLNSFSKPIEIAIALTIIYTGVHVIKPLMSIKETYITFIFGLIHGSAFGITLNEWGLTDSQKILSLAGFNVGIEIMQIIVVLICLPLIYLSKFNYYKHLRVTLASLTIFVSIFWALERITERSNFVTEFVENLI